MAHERRFRFGVHVASAGSRKDWVGKIRRIEELGYTSLLMPDHFDEQLGPLPALVTAAESSSLRIGTLVLDNDYRHPVVLAKEAATIDILTEGRLELGIGAGWLGVDYERSGIPYDRPSVRVDRFEEGLKVLKGAFGGSPFSFKGDHYTITNYDGRPKCVQSPHPPILIGGGGKRMLTIAAREANIIGIHPNHSPGAFDEAVSRDSTAARTDRKLAWIRDAAGSRFDEIELSVLAYIVAVTKHRRRSMKALAPHYFLSAHELRQLPYALIGSVDQICEAIEYRRERWALSYFIVNEGVIEAFAPVVARLRGK
jgi:probable F420-dependent oxidoreductase